MLSRQDNTDSWLGVFAISTAGKYFLVFLGGVLALSVFYWPIFMSKFNALPGNSGDGRYILVILENWYRVFQGAGNWRSPPFFYPLKDTLGYSDGLFLMALPYSLARSVGLDEFSAYQALLFILSGLGYVAAIYLLHKELTQPLWASMVGALVLVLSNAMYVNLDHAQLIALYLLLAICIFGVKYVKASNKFSLSTWASGAAFSILYGLLFLTGYYIAWLFGLYVIIAGIVALLLTCRIAGTANVTRAIGRFIGKQWIQLTAFGVLFLASLTPFFLVYIPMVSQGRVRTFSQVLTYSPTIAGLVNVSSGNLVWSTPVDWIYRFVGYSRHHEIFGFAIFLLLFSLTIVAISAKKILWRDGCGQLSSLKNSLTSNLGVATLGISVVISFILVIKVDDYSAWWIIYHTVPGAKAIRAASRYLLVLLVPITIITVIGLTKLKARAGPWTVAIACMLLVGGEVNVASNCHWYKDSQRTMFARVAMPPARCHAFFLAPVAKKTTYPWWAWMTAAMMVSVQKNLPTLNGYSGWFPKGWHLGHPDNSNYSKEITQWLLRHPGLKDVCSLDLSTGGWHRYPVKQNP